MNESKQYAEFVQIFEQLSAKEKAMIGQAVLSGDRKQVSSRKLKPAIAAYDALNGLEQLGFLMMFAQAAKGAMAYADPTGEKPDEKPEEKPAKLEEKSPATSANSTVVLPSVQTEKTLLWHKSNKGHKHYTGKIKDGRKVLLEAVDLPYGPNFLNSKGYITKTAQWVLTIAFAPQLLELDKDGRDALSVQVAQALKSKNQQAFRGQRHNDNWLKQAIVDLAIVLEDNKAS